MTMRRSPSVPVREVGRDAYNDTWNLDTTTPTSPTPNSRSCGPFYHSPRRWAGHRPTCAPCSTLSSTWSAPAASGACCPTTSRPGAPSTPGTAAGAKTAPWERLNEALWQQVRTQAGRDPSPRSSAADSQSVKTTPQGGAKGFDNGKKVHGRKRHIWVDSMGLLLSVLVTAADVHDARAACTLFHGRVWDELPRLEVVYADSQYTAGYLAADIFSWAPFRLQVVSRPPGEEGWVQLPQRWVVERTFAWLYRSRRLSKDYERLTESSEAMVEVSMLHLMLRRLAPVPKSYTQRFRYAA